MYILDTDHVSFLQRKVEEAKLIIAKLATIEAVEVAVTVQEL